MRTIVNCGPLVGWTSRGDAVAHRGRQPVLSPRRAVTSRATRRENCWMSDGSAVPGPARSPGSSFRFASRPFEGVRVAGVIVVNRFRVAEGDAEAFAGEARAALAALAERPGYESGHLGRNVDDPALWVLATTWRDVGSYRRALSAYDVKIPAVPLLSRAIDEPSAYELVGPDASALNRARPRTLD